MEYKKDFIIKPKEVSSNGRVTFTDGTNDLTPNQLTCEAYGYRYNEEDGCCYAFKNNSKVRRLFSNTTNTLSGSNAIRQGEVGIGGGGFDSEAGLLQMSLFQCSNRTTDASATILVAQGEATTTDYIVTQANSILGFEVYVIGLVTGGSAGTAGHYIYIKITGAVRTDNSLAQTIVQSQSTIASLGTSGTATMVTSEGQLAVPEVPKLAIVL